MPLFLIVSEIYGLKSRNSEKFEIFSKFLAHPVETPWLILTVFIYTRMCTGLCPTYWTTFGIAERNRNDNCPMHEWDHPHVIYPLFAPHGGRWPPKGEKTRPDPGYARVQNMAWIGPRVAEVSLTEQTNKHTVKQIPRPSLYERMAGNKCVSKTDTNPPFAFQIAFPLGTDFTGFLQGGSKIRDL